MRNERTSTSIACWDICSVAGKKRRNDDYGLFDPNVGGCLADGIGRYPLADAIARYACHAAFESMRKGFDAKEAMTYAQAKVADFARTAESSESGTALALLNRVNEGFQVAWLGDVACYALRAGASHLELLTAPHRRGSQLTRYVGSKPFNPSTTTFEMQAGDRIVLCTDGVWDELSEQELLQAVAASETPQEACAKLVLDRRPNDDATAIAVFAN